MDSYGKIISKTSHIVNLFLIHILWTYFPMYSNSKSNFNVLPLLNQFQCILL